jgi:cytochrome oxidase Cu insertion factor (SCO1/SenC/PrrC family)
MRSILAPLLACALLALAACKPSTSSGTTAATATTASTPSPPATTLPLLGRGDKAPDFSLEGSDGKTHTLAEHAGKEVVVVAWFPKAFTGG